MNFYLYLISVMLLYALPLIGQEHENSYPVGYYDNCSAKMDAQTEALLNLINQAPLVAREMPLEQLRARTYVDPSSLSVLPEIESIENISIPGKNGPIKLRIYKPKSSSNQLLPVFMYIHGGGWIIGNPDEFDSISQEICRKAGCIFVYVDYGLAPEHPFPQPIEDCYAAALWLSKHIQEKGGDPRKIAIGGDSAGGNLTAAVTLKARELHKPHFLCQILTNPATNYNFETLSCIEFGEKYFLTKGDLKYCWDNYLQQSSGRNPYASPLLADSLSNLPPAYLLISNFDPLRDDGLAYGLRLHRNGVPTVIKRFNTIHGFYRFELDIAKEGIAYIASVLKEQFKENL